MKTFRLALVIPLTAMIALLGSCGCGPSPRINDDIPDVMRGYKPEVQQVLDNVAAFMRDPGAWPTQVLVYRGSFESRRQWTGAVGTSTKIENSFYSMTRWELASLDDPYDIKRVRLLYQWQVGCITFDDLQSRWDEIRDRPALDANGKAILGPDGKPAFLPLALPVTRDTRRDWITYDRSKSPSGMSGRCGASGAVGTIVIYVADTESADQFTLAILSAMPNTRIRPAGAMPP